jgi:hypothetical protein
MEAPVMRTASRFLTALFGTTLIVAVAGGAGAQPSGPGGPAVTTPASATSTPEDPAPETAASETTSGTPTSPVPTSPTPAPPGTSTPVPDVAIEVGTVSIRAATLSEDRPIPAVVGQVARCGAGDIVGTVETGPDGIASVDASLGCYTVSLVSHPPGFEPVSVGPWTVELSFPGQVAQVGFVLQRSTPPGEGTLVVEARHAYAGTPVAGVTAAVTSCADNTRYGYLTTNTEGHSATRLPLNCYIVTLDEAPADTTVVADGPFTVELDSDGVTRTVEFTLHHSRPPEPTVQGRLVKMDRLTGALLPGAIFDFGPCNSEWNQRQVTGSDGQIPLALAPGCHVAKEVAAPDGYIADTTPITFYAKEGEYFTIQALNTPQNAQPVHRNPDVRVPIRSIPAGSMDRG